MYAMEIRPFVVLRVTHAGSVEVVVELAQQGKQLIISELGAQRGLVPLQTLLRIVHVAL